MKLARTFLWIFLAVLAPEEAAGGQSIAGESVKPILELPFNFNGPPPPVPPEVITRDSAGHATVRATRLASPLKFDGRLDDPVYQTTKSFSGFIQTEPREGEPAAQKTDVWVFFDSNNLYVAVRAWESHMEKLVGKVLRRDDFNTFNNDFIEVMLDPFYDRRNSVLFVVNAIGGLSDGEVSNERDYNADWNPVWDAKVSRFDDSWTAEIAIPFKSLRYRPGRSQIWGFQLQRYNAWKNESAFLTPIPASFDRTTADEQISFSATLVGLEAPEGAMKIDIKPYVISNIVTDATANPRTSNAFHPDAGLDVKYGITPNLTADFTYNTDFAQVEADQQQVNLTRFSLFFPEKRDFFLENRGIFSFGGASSATAGAGDTPILFYSRAIGLNEGRVVPLRAGARLTGRIRRFQLGMMNIETGDEKVSGSKPTNFTVLRMRRDILRKSAIGMMYTGRTVDAAGGARNDAFGIDGIFGFFDNLTFNTYWAQTHTPGTSSKGWKGVGTSHRLQMNYAGDRYGLQAERLFIGSQFNPQVGFVRRPDQQRSFVLGRFSPRLRRSKRIRKLLWTGSATYIQNTADHLESRSLDGDFAIEFHNRDRLDVHYTQSYEYLPQPFSIASNVTLPVGGYNFGSALLEYDFGQLRPVSGRVSIQSGTFYNGHKTVFNIASGLVNFSPRISLQPTVSINRVNLVQGAFTTNLIGTRATYSMTPRMFTSALIQYNSITHSISSNVRFRWEYRPGSEFFIVYNEQRGDSPATQFPDAFNRALIFKVNKLFRF